MKNVKLTQLGVLALVLLAVAGCREEEKDRQLFFKPGEYLGKQEPAISKDLMHQLKSRTALQAGSGGAAGTSVSVGTTGSSVRPPAPKGAQ